MTRRGSVLRKAPAVLAAAVALVASFLAMDARPTGADPLMVSNVSVSLSVPRRF